MTSKLDFQIVSEHEMLESSHWFYEKMRTRRTVRDFDSKPVPMAVIRHALMAAGTAPSGANKQPWHFAVTSDPQVKTTIREAAEIEERAFYEERAPEQWLDALAPLGTNASKPFLETAPVLIGVFLQKSSQADDGSRLKNYYTYESVGIACGMLISALHLAGLATLTHTPSPMKFLTTAFERPKTERPYLLLVVGYPDAACEVPNITKKPLGDIASIVGQHGDDWPG